MFPDSQIAKGFQCGRKKISYIISDGLGPYFKEKMVQELVQPEVFYSIMIDETPVPEAKVQQLDIFARYYSVNTQNVVVEPLQSFHLGHATADELFSCVEDALNELLKKNMIFEKFQTLFQSKEPLLHIFYDEMVALVKQTPPRFASPNVADPDQTKRTPRPKESGAARDGTEGQEEELRRSRRKPMRHKPTGTGAQGPPVMDGRTTITTVTISVSDIFTARATPHSLE
ncbi:hypothetical protein HPB47_021192 [Ixodes persulcatus]|uniref:Uncharacterized protein n=1 Tax=Ixodes persulcatus TaxID=34615 RepID=A0AC60QD91_IXOPE|nr:hypothetical protein HPB47_021192 [Ixodes persulcatus]